MTRERISVGIVWLAAVIGVIGVAVFAEPARHLVWVSIIMLGLICLTCALQLALQRSEGFIMRLAMSFVGAIVVLGIASVIFAVLGGDAVIGIPSRE